MVRNIIQIGDHRLNQKSQKIGESEIFSREIKTLISDLLDTCNADPETSAGLSAVQLGELKRIYVVRRLDIEKEEDKPIWEVMINPEVQVIGNDTTVTWEGCMSIGTDENRLFAPIERVAKVKATYLNIEAEQKELEAEGFFAHIVQHEQDHLNGILFLKHVKDPSQIWKGKDLDAYIKKHKDYPPIT